MNSDWNPTKVKIRTPLPGPKSKGLVNRETLYLATSTKTAPVAIKRGKGIWFEDMDGNVFLDYTNGMVGSTGFCHPVVVAAIKKQADRFLYFNGPDFYYDVQGRLAQKLCALAPGKFRKKVFLSNSGAESVEAALKIVRHATGRKRTIAFIGAFHGRTLGALSLTGSKAVHREGFAPIVPDVTHIPYAYCYRCAYKMRYPSCNVWCAQILEDLYFKSVVPPSEVGAIFVEPIQGEGGYIVPPREFLVRLREIADRHGILLVADEVQTGFGKTGKMLAMEHFGVVPDIICMAKAIASGLPVGATVFNRKLDFKVGGAHSNTYGGSPIPAAAALATIAVIEEEGLLDKVAKLGNYFRRGLNALKRKHGEIGDIRGFGFMQGLELVRERKSREPARALRDRVVAECLRRGLLLIPCGVSGIRLTPALVAGKLELDSGLSLLGEALSAAKKGK